jgi:hypothetical protein
MCLCGKKTDNKLSVLKFMSQKDRQKSISGKKKHGQVQKIQFFDNFLGLGMIFFVPNRKNFSGFFKKKMNNGKFYCTNCNDLLYSKIILSTKSGISLFYDFNVVLKHFFNIFKRFLVLRIKNSLYLCNGMRRIKLRL